METPFDSAISFLSPELKEILSGVCQKVKNNTYEIRLRTDRCIVLVTDEGTLFADKDKVHTWAQEAMKWCVSNNHTPISKQGFLRQLFSMYPMLKIVPTKSGDKCSRIIRMRG